MRKIKNLLRFHQSCVEDDYLAEHNERVAYYAKKLAVELNLDKNLCNLCHRAAAVHDVGKIGIPKEILFKPGKLSFKEYEIIKMHAIIGEEILYAEDKEAAKIVRHHHERWDGRGYPDGLSGDEIPQLSRIIAVADAYDAMTSKRTYRKKPKTRAEALTEIARCAGSQFDPDIAYAFVMMMREGVIVKDLIEERVRIEESKPWMISTTR